MPTREEIAITTQEIDETMNVELTEEMENDVQEAKRRGLSKVTDKAKARSTYITKKLSEGLSLNQIIIPKELR